MPWALSHPLRAQHSQGGHVWNRKGRLVVTRFVASCALLGRTESVLFSTFLWLGVKFTKRRRRRRNPQLNTPTFSIDAHPRAQAPQVTGRQSGPCLLLAASPARGGPCLTCALTSPGSPGPSNRRGAVYFRKLQHCTYAQGHREGFCSWLWVDWAFQGRQ